MENTFQNLTLLSSSVQDIGRVTGPPIFNPVANEIYLNFESTTPCQADKHFNYTSLIAFHCKRGVSMVSGRRDRPDAGAPLGEPGSAGQVGRSVEARQHLQGPLGLLRVEARAPQGPWACICSGTAGDESAQKDEAAAVCPSRACVCMCARALTWMPREPAGSP